MRTALIGHRGVGKSSLLKRIELYYKEVDRDVLCLDLDDEITQRSGKTVREIFVSGGEESFRQIERETFRQIDEETASRSDVFLAIGAGFDPSFVTEGWRALWVRRPTDIQGRIFTDRPRLNGRVPALQEFNERFHRRQAAYRARADEVLLLDEGLETPDSAERDVLLGNLRDLQGAITILKDVFRTRESFERWVQARIRWGVRWFELRDDLLSEADIELGLQLLPRDRVLLSFRLQARLESTAALLAKYRVAFDWPLELGSQTVEGIPHFISLHARADGQSLTDALARFPTYFAAKLKAALPVHDFRELEEGRRWQAAAPDSRIFLPLSKDGRWQWYRTLLGRSLALNFFRESDGGSADQPTLLQWVRRRNLEKDPQLAHLPREKMGRFAAVLGDPVRHSRSPMEHRDFFAIKVAPIFAIQVSIAEWQQGAIDFLGSLGLTWAAVTAPLKGEAFKLCATRDRDAEELRAINTIQRPNKQGVWSGINTDLIGFRHAIHDENLGRIAVWGGGGTLNMLIHTLTEAEFFSLRTGENRADHGPRAEGYQPDTVIWAVGRSRQDKVGERFPPSSWKPSLVFDLNYAEDSPGRAFALSRGSRYVSGLAMFRAQAEAQRRFWEL